MNRFIPSDQVDLKDDIGFDFPVNLKNSWPLHPTVLDEKGGFLDVLQKD